MAAAAKDPKLKKRTLTNLYNERPTWLRLAHEALDRAVLAAYAATDPAGDWSEGWAAVWVDAARQADRFPLKTTRGDPTQGELNLAKHTISVELPQAEVINKDAIITVRGDGEIIGTLTISRGNIEWYSKQWKKPTRLTWAQFDRLMHENWRPS
jgi:hypothetical protein